MTHYLRTLAARLCGLFVDFRRAGTAPVRRRGALKAHG